MYPKDAIAGGTWIAASAQKRIACLLNGAFEKHKRSLPYSRSRGQILLESFDYQRITEFCTETNLENVEPFTLILIDYSHTFELVELRWDGTQKHRTTIPFAQSTIWSSATLYDAAAREKRAEWFTEWLAQPSKNTPESTSENTQENTQENTPKYILRFHATQHGSDPKTDILMQRENGLQTISISQIVVQNSATEQHTLTFFYNDLVENKSVMLF